MQPSGIETNISERVTPAELARRLGVDRRTVNKWFRDQRISPPGADGRVDLAQATREREATESARPRDQARKAQHDAARAAKRAQAAAAADRSDLDRVDYRDAASDPVQDLGDSVIARLGNALKAQQLRLTQAKADLAIADRDTRAGLLLHRADVEGALADFGATFRRLMDGLSDRLAPAVAGHSDVAIIHGIVRAHVAEVDDQVAAALERGLDAAVSGSAGR